MAADEKELKITFLSKREYFCPLCDTMFHKEELYSGGGRLNAGPLTKELRQLYIPTAKYGEIFPVVYHALVCPDCWFASMENDFSNVPANKKEIAINDRENRMKDAALIFPNLDFHENRTLMEGAASQYLVLRCYDYYNKDASPTIKQGLASLRCAWLLDELHKKFPEQNYDWVATLFRKKAEFLYNEALAREQSGKETLSGIKDLGPDTVRGPGYEGMLYLCAYLRYNFGTSQNAEERKTALEDARRTISKLFGMGKASKDKPGAFLELARSLYDTINQDLAQSDI